MGANRRNAFTLVEVLIVVVIMAVLAATIIPQFTNSTQEAKANTARFNLHTLRAQIELYKANHDGKSPSATLAELTVRTNAAGDIGTSAAHVYGPYMREIPENPLNGSRVVAAPAAVPPTAIVDGAGWLYDATSGRIWLNHADHLAD